MAGAGTRGATVAEASTSLVHLAQTAFHLRPDNIADGNLHALLLDDINKLSNARRERLLAARTPIPAILWFVLISGGIITVAFASFLGAPKLWMHLAMSSLLAISGAMVLLVIIALSNPFRGDFRVSVPSRSSVSWRTRHRKPIRGVPLDGRRVPFGELALVPVRIRRRDVARRVQASRPDPSSATSRPRPGSAATAPRRAPR